MSSHEIQGVIEVVNGISNVARVDFSVIDNRMRCFSEIITTIIFSTFPMEFELFLSLSIAKPMKIHVPRFRFFELHIFIGKASCCGIVGLCESWGLWVAHSDEKSADVDTNFCVVENSMGFGFCCRGNNMFESFAFNENHTIVNAMLRFVK